MIAQNISSSYLSLAGKLHNAKPEDIHNASVSKYKTAHSSSQSSGVLFSTFRLLKIRGRGMKN